ncbi:hypothetical protein Ocin01_06424 [Orchesella cincta]|uniref:Uncharacterized protein n=1 Tax=Orchesella cincta TaxID=48709 RepID=A0A1D2N4R4_ORCCI|nr:hypothetical protein Ocin01_06424 [Orchesella cincta]
MAFISFVVFAIGLTLVNGKAVPGEVKDMPTLLEAKVEAGPMKLEEKRSVEFRTDDSWDHFRVIDPLENGFLNEGGFEDRRNFHNIAKRVLPYSDERIRY